MCVLSSRERPKSTWGAEAEPAGVQESRRRDGARQLALSVDDYSFARVSREQKHSHEEHILVCGGAVLEQLSIVDSLSYVSTYVRTSSRGPDQT